MLASGKAGTRTGEETEAGGPNMVCSWTVKRPTWLERTICAVLIISKVPLSDYAKQKEE